MNPSKPTLATYRHHRILSSPAAVLSDLCDPMPLYIHARNWMAEMTMITPLTACLVDDGQDWISFPEQGLNLSLTAIEYLHSVAVEHPSRSSLGLEIATRGEPRSVSIAAIPALSNLAGFTAKLARHDSEFMATKEYEQWRGRQLIRPSACPCCAQAAEDRRENVAASPLAKILSAVVNECRPLHCRLFSPAFRLALSLVPKSILLNQGRIILAGSDDMSLLEIDPGLCHSITIHRRRIDAEMITSMRIYNSLGVPELTVETPGHESYDDWLRLCKSA